MSFITFSLLAGLLQGTMGRFDPEYIQSTIVLGATLLALEASAARVSVSNVALRIPSMSLLDFVCYSGCVDLDLALWDFVLRGCGWRWMDWRVVGVHPCSRNPPIGHR